MGRKPITVSLPEDLVKETGIYCRKKSLTMSEIARDALREYLYRQEMEQARKSFTSHVQKLAINSEEALQKSLLSK
jgi:metal-responsive CopG/Arc/MetJ family transcriptional regulator